MSTRAEAADDPETAAPGGDAPAARARPAHRMHSLRTRMLVVFVGLLAAATLGSVLIARQVMETRLVERSSAELHREVEKLRRLAAGVDPATGRPFGDDVRRLFSVYFDTGAWADGQTVLSFVDGEPFLRSPTYDAVYRLDRDAALLAQWRSVPTPRQGSVKTPAGRVDYLAVPVRQGEQALGTLVVAHFRAADRGVVRDATIVTVVVGLAVLLVGTLLAWRMADGVLRPVEAVATAARGISETDLTRRIAVGGRDEVAAMAATFNAMLDRLEGAFASQRRFLDDAGHELRTPITIVRGHLELLEEDPAEREETLALVLDEIDRMSRMVDELILLAKAERPDFLRRAPLDVGTLTDELLGKAGALGERDWVLDARGDGVVTADRQRLTEAVMQLAENAVAHTGHGQEVGLGSALDGGVARFWVRDTGDGVALEDQAAIFERFERRGPRSPEGGFGLGLSIVRAIAEAHGGRATVESRPAQGATFSIEVPLDGATYAEGSLWHGY